MHDIARRMFRFLTIIVRLSYRFLSASIFNSIFILFLFFVRSLFPFIIHHLCFVISYHLAHFVYLSSNVCRQNSHWIIHWKWYYILGFLNIEHNMLSQSMAFCACAMYVCCTRAVFCSFTECAVMNTIVYNRMNVCIGMRILTKNNCIM